MMKRIIKRGIGFLFLFLILAFVLIVIAFYPTVKDFYVYAKDTVNNGSKDDFHYGEPTYIYDSQGNILVKLSGEVESNYITEIPDTVAHAFVAIEDRSFYENTGFDVKGILRVLVNYVKSGGEEKHGASTITQQVVKNIYLSQEVSIERKAKELLMSYFMSKKYTKQEIMEFYCNDIYFGHAFYGIENAAKGYFNCSAAGLSLAQTAFICAIPNNPTIYDPVTNMENTKNRQAAILSAMLELGYITDDEYQTAISEEITLVMAGEDTKYNDYMSTYAINCATKWLMRERGFKFRYSFKSMKQYKKYWKKYETAYEEAKGELKTGGYHIKTTLNPKTQAKLQKIVNKQLKAVSVSKTDNVYNLQGSVTVIDNKTGKITSIIGGRSQKVLGDYSLNRAFQSYRQPGSSIKPIAVYAPAIDNGYERNALLTSVDVVAARNKDATQLSGSRLSMEYSLQHSINGSAWWLFSKIGVKAGLSPLFGMQFTHICPDDYQAASALGGLTYGTNTVEMAGAYAALANHGVYRETTCIKSITKADGEELYEEYTTQVYSPKAADTTLDIMKGVLTNGTAKGLMWSSSTSVEAACKTGTTNDNKDGWLCGVTPDYTVCVWVGYDSPTANAALQGATYPAAIWKESMLCLLDGKSKKKLDVSHKNDKNSIKIAYDVDSIGNKEYSKRQKQYNAFEEAYAVMERTDRQLYTYYTDLSNNYKTAKACLDKIDDMDYVQEWSVRLEELYHKMNR